MLVGWGMALAGCSATIFIGWNVLAAHALGGLLDLFQAPAAGRHPADNADLIWPLIPSSLAIVGNAWILWFGSPRDNGLSPWWLVPALLMSLGTFLFGIWVCIDVWHAPSAATG